MKRLAWIVMLSVGLTARAAGAAEAPMGQWKTVDEKTGAVQSVVEIYDQGGKLFGKIVSLASVAGWIGSNDGEAHYCAAKAAVMGYTRAVAAEVGKYGIRVNAIAPGLIYNEFLRRIYPDEMFRAAEKRTPLGRVGQPQDIANLALFLVSDESSFITGEVMCCSGGLYVHA